MNIKNLISSYFILLLAVSCGHSSAGGEDEVRAQSAFFVDRSVLYLSALDGEASFKILSGADWKISVDDEWLEVNPWSGLASEDTVTVSLVAENNPLFEHRSTILHISSEASQHSISVNQFPNPHNPQIEIERRQNIPHIYIDVYGQQIKDKKKYIKGTVTIKDPEMLYSSQTEQVIVMTENGIRGRGNSTWDWPKKPYKLKFDNKESILGFPADKEWCLLANYSDRTLLRNLTAMKLSEICGFSWTPRMCSVEVTLDGNYLGVYNFCEHKKISEHRVNIKLPEGDTEESITGGYYFEIDDRSASEPYFWKTSMGIPMLVNEPEQPTSLQFEYVKQYFQNFEDALRKGDNSEATGYRHYIDLKSFIDYYIVQELTKNPDGSLRLSSFLTKEKGKKLEMYHLWDFDLTLGNCGYFEPHVGNGPENFFIKDSGWYVYLFRDSLFVGELQKRWNLLYPQLKEITRFIDEQALYLEKAKERNFQKWSITGNDISWVHMPNKGTYEAELKYLKDFYNSRLEWLNKEINKL